MQLVLAGRGRASLLRLPVRLASGLQAQGWWIPDHKPRRFPETEAERRSAAAKYGLREEDYEPYPMGWDCVGEYPNLGPIAHAHKDPYENWSHEHWRRNYGEPVPWEFKLRTPDRKNYTGLEHHEIGVNAWLPTFLVPAIFLFVMYGLYAWVPDIRRIVLPYMPKQMPYDFKRAFPFECPTAYPIRNYTFEPARPEE